MIAPARFPSFASWLLAAVLLLATTLTTQAATSVSQFGITWTFDRDYPTGQFANGDYWVVGPVKITSITPKSTTSNGATMHGTMINPLPNTAHGFDSRIRNNTYDAAKNVARSFPIMVAAGSSVVSAESLATSVSGNDSQLKTIAVLTVVAAAPAPGSFRPPYAGSDKTVRWNKSQLNYRGLRSVAPVEGTPNLATVADYFERPFIDLKTSWAGSYLQPALNNPSYGREISQRVGLGLLSLQLNYSDAQKEKLLVRLVQWGIDIHGLAINGMTWKNDGGHKHGRKGALLLAGHVLNSPELLGYADAKNKFIFQEDQQTFYVSSVDVALRRKSNDGRYRAPYTTAMIGTPEWGGKHTGEPEGDASQWETYYRDVCGASTVGPVLAIRMMGLESKWNWPALFDYIDRYWKVEGTNPDTGTNAIQPWVRNMWRSYRNSSSNFTPDNTSTAGIWQHVGFAAQNGMFTCAFDTVPSQLAMDGVVGLSHGPASASSALAASIRFAPSGFMEASNGSGFSAVNVLKYAAGVKYRVVLTVDLAARKYSATVTPAGGTAVTIANNYTFRSTATATTLDQVSFMSTVGAHSVLDVGVQTITPPAPEPTPTTPPPAPAQPAPTPTPATVIRINAGGSSFTDDAGNVWSADKGYTTSGTKVAKTTSAIAETNNDKLYQTERYMDGGNLDYAFDVPNGTYSVRLLFAETYAGAMAKGKRVFDVAIEGNVIAKDLDIFTQAGAGNRALAINATVTVSDGRMGLKFVRKVQNPTISGIEIITATATAPTPSQPVTTPEPVVTTPEPIVTPPPAPPAPTTPTNTTVVRINVGGGSFTDRAGNVWSADKYHTTSGSDVSTSSSSIANTSDDKLFQTGRYKDGANLDYAIAVPNGTYQMKLLFSENYSGTMAKGKRVFDVAVEGNVVVSKLDIYALAGGGNRALTITKTVTVTDGKLGLKLIRKVQNPIISGIELVAVK